MNDPSSYDVAIVGAGPAGSAAAYALSRGGLRAVIIEKSRLPRYKTCGGGLLGRTLRLLPEELGPLVERDCFVAELQHHDPRLLFSAKRARPIVSMVMRDCFDHHLTLAAEKAGATVLTDECVIDFKLRSNGVVLTTTNATITAPVVVAADGVTSLIARKAGLPELPEVIPALECEVTVRPEDFDKFRESARFDFGLIPFGYAWVFPKKEHLSIGVLTTQRGSCNLNDEYRRYLAALGLSKPLAEERHGYMIPICPRPRLFAVSSIFLVGDAAGLADPVTAEGISAAILSAQLAAKAILAHRTSAVEAMAAYRESMNRTLLAELRVARVLARGLYGFPRVRAWLFRRHGQRLSEFMTDLVLGERGYREAVGRPLNYLKLFRPERAGLISRHG